MPRKYLRTKEKQLSRERIQILWEQAQQSARAGHIEIAREQMRSARKIAQKTRTKLPHSISRRVCKLC
ncbi:MAG: ribonuclease P protein component 4, partial [Candidatus Thorarchaeota archaeon]